MLWVKALHIIAVITWFAAIFYLPRLFVYHAMCDDVISDTRFKLMEYRLYYAIGMPSAIVTSVTGVWLILVNRAFYISQGWMQAKIVLVGLLWLYFIYCGVLLARFARNANTYSHVYYRIFNEIPTVLLIAIIILVTVHPF